MSRPRKFPLRADLTTPCAVCRRPLGEHAGTKCPRPPATDAIPAPRPLAPDRTALPGQTGMLGVAGRHQDGRKGRVFSLRLTEPERKMIEEARAVEAERARGEGRWLGRRPLGLWIREAALGRAFAIVDGPRPRPPSSSPAPRRSR